MYLCYNNYRMGDAMMPKKNVIKLCIFVFVLGVIVGITSLVIAESINSDEVLYDNSNSNTSNGNVQDVLDDMYNIIDHSSLGFSLLIHNPGNITSEPVAGLYRYQGVTDNSHDVNNYICFGTFNKDTCTGNIDNYLYRIIGINSAGDMKIIKYSNLGSRGWDNGQKGSDWAHTALYLDLNDSLFLNNTDYIPDSTWSNKIMSVDWPFGIITNVNASASTLASIELNFTDSVNAKIGLVYLHDYYYALGGDINCKITNCNSNWMFNKTEYYGKMWTPIRYADNGAWTTTGGDAVSTSRCVRPVFFLRATERIASGSGTITDPYILS